MSFSNNKKSEQLEMPIGTASGQLRKIIIFHLIKLLGFDICFQCGNKIKEVKQLSIEHKIPWLDSINPKESFFDINNIAFSHLLCNIGAGGNRGSHNRKKTHCPIGHKYTKENTCTDKRNIRHCNLCLRDRMRNLRSKRKSSLVEIGKQTTPRT